MDILGQSFAWDEAKRAANLARHGLDFIDATALFDGRPGVTFPSPRGNEARFLTTGRLGAVFVTLVWTERSEAIRLISFRRARDAETRAYRARHGDRGRGDA